MYFEGQKNAKVGIVSIDIYKDSYRLRFTYPRGTRHQFTIAKATPEGWVTAIRAAQFINRDIDLGDFDATYARYSPKHAQAIEVREQESEAPKANLRELWENYKELKSNTVQESTKKKDWRAVDRALGKISADSLRVDNASKFINELGEIYAVSTMRYILRSLYAAVNLGVEEGRLPNNPYLKYFSPYGGKKGQIECFEPEEVRAIIKAFKEDTFNPPASAYKHSYYSGYVQMLALTGMRPEEATALTWDDVKYKSGRVFIRINKAYTAGVLKDTKTHAVRLFLCNNQLIELIDTLPRLDNELGLMFSSVSSRSYINQGNWRADVWKVVVSGLVRKGEVIKCQLF